MWKKLKNKITGKCEELNNLGKALADENYIHNKFNTMNEVTMLRLEKEELIARCHGFSKEDWEIIIGEAPIELCHNRIGRELSEAKAFKKRVGAAMSSENRTE